MPDEQGRPQFVLHDHRKPQPHYDLRLEESGVLRSWAVPKGLPTDPARNRLAIEVDDHELDHLGYEDEHKSVADTGWWEEDRRDDGFLGFILHGRESVRRYALIRTEGGRFGRGRPSWLVHLSREQPDR